MTEVSYARQFLTLLDSRPIKISGDHIQDPRTLNPNVAYCLPRRSNPFQRPTASTQSTTTTSTSKTTHSPSSSSTTLHIRASKAPAGVPNPVVLSSINASNTSIYEIKKQVSSQTGYAPEKVKIIWEKKPVNDSKLVSEVVATASSSSTKDGPIEFGVMYIGQPTLKATSSSSASVAAPIIAGPPGSEASLATQSATDASTHAGGDVRMAGVGGGEASVEAGIIPAQGTAGWDVLQTDGFWDDLQGFVMQRTRDEDVAMKVVGHLKGSWQSLR